MKFVSIVWLMIFATVGLAQGDLQKMVETEHDFAKYAAANGTKAAFLNYIADDGVLFLPDRVNGREYWNGRGESKGLLSWAPNYADISANGILGYTTGNWDYRPDGRDGKPVAFGEFITLWLRGPDGRYKFVVDIGIDHERPAAYSTEWTTAAKNTKDLNEKGSSAADSSAGFYAAVAAQGPVKAYRAYASDELRAYREGKLPLVGKANVIAALKKDEGTIAFAKRSVFFGSADLAYNTNTYTRTVAGKVVEKGNTVQIWKLTRGKWQIVLDVFKPVP